MLRPLSALRLRSIASAGAICLCSSFFSGVTPLVFAQELQAPVYGGTSGGTGSPDNFMMPMPASPAPQPALIMDYTPYQNHAVTTGNCCVPSEGYRDLGGGRVQFIGCLSNVATGNTSTTADGRTINTSTEPQKADF